MTVGVAGYHDHIAVSKAAAPKAQKSLRKGVVEKVKEYVLGFFFAIGRFFYRLHLLLTGRVHLENNADAYRLAYSFKNLRKEGVDPYVILSIDGGGVRGVIPVRVLKIIEEILGVKVTEAFDCITGTSTGGIIAAGLSVPSTTDPTITRYSAADMENLYNTLADKVFSRSLWHKIKSLFGMIKAKYQKPTKVLKDVIGEVQIQHCIPKLIITSVDLLTGKLVLFENKINASAEILLKKNIRAITVPVTTPISDALEGTAAAPTYFPSKILGNFNLVDGGIAVNNPAQIAALLAMNGEAKDRPIFILSLGTGKNPTEPVTSKKAVHWGVLQWIQPLIEYLIDANSQIANQQLEMLTNSNPNINYFRFQMKLDSGPEEELDNTDPKNLRRLQAKTTRCFNHCMQTEAYKQLIQLLQQKVKKSKLSPIPKPKIAVKTS